jgi:hypothetical protein
MRLTKKARRAVACFSVLVTPNLSLRTCLLLPYMLGLDFIFFPDSIFSFYYYFQHKITKNKK